MTPGVETDPVRRVRILHLEDSARDVQYVEDLLEDQGVAADITQVARRAPFEAALALGGFDVVICDYSLPDLDGLSALRLVRAVSTDLPVIIVSGAIDPVAAVTCLREGATDLLLKDRLERLPSAIRRALEERQQRVQLREAEARVQHSQKLEVVGRLAGGIAHDFNTLLTVITATSELVLNRLAPDDPLVPDLAEIRSAGERGAALVAQLMAFSRQQILRPRVLDPVVLVQSLERSLMRLVGAHIHCVLELPPVSTRIRVDPGQFEQVLLNLVINARDAMRQGGTLAVGLREEDAPAEHKARFPMGRCVHLWVRDTGIGMTPEVQRRAFEPFFTTKGTEGGTGLGLSTVYGIVEQSGGVVWPESAPGAGTTFHLLFPVSPDPIVAEPVLTPPTGIPRVPIGTGSILVADDDPALRQLVKRTLTSSGYTVHAVGSGPEALAYLESRETPIDLLLTDLVMPDMSGRELAARVRSRYPELPILFMSGYTEDEVTRQSLHDEGQAFVPKPFTVATLTRHVAMALGHEG